MLRSTLTKMQETIGKYTKLPPASSVSAYCQQMQSTRVGHIARQVAQSK